MKVINQYLGITIGVIYGLLIRLICDQEDFYTLYNIYSISFLWITPIVIGLLPILFSHNHIYKSKIKLFTYPIITIIAFLICALITRLEDLICILIIGLPFMVIAGILGLILGYFVRERIKHKTIYSIVLLPFILNPIENRISNHTEHYTVSSEIVINKNNEFIFPQLLSVPTLSKADYQLGIYQYLGIPRPIHSTLVKKDNELSYRIGYFTDNLSLYEYITAIDTNHFVDFKIDLAQSQLRNTPTDQHILKSDYFKFEHINYSLIKISEHQTRIILNCQYSISSKMNWYANLWAKSIIHDFEYRLLCALKHNLEKQS